MTVKFRLTALPGSVWRTVNKIHHQREDARDDGPDDERGLEDETLLAAITGTPLTRQEVIPLLTVRRAVAMRIPGRKNGHVVSKARVGRIAILRPTP